MSDTIYYEYDFRLDQELSTTADILEIRKLLLKIAHGFTEIQPDFLTK